MKAGRELDAVVAEKVMGWTGVGWEDHHGTKMLRGVPPERQPGGRAPDYAHGHSAKVPRYSSLIQQAWNVFDRPEYESWSIYRWNSDILEGGHQWCIEDADGNERASATTAPLAICAAALKDKLGDLLEGVS